MKITAIKQQVKTDQRVSVFIDGIYSFSLSYDQLLEQKLVKDQELDNQHLEQLKKLSDEGKLKQRALEWLMLRPHSTNEFKNYLYKKKAESELIDAWVEEFTAKKYLNDKKFARWFAEQRLRKNKSIREITSELRSKGVDSSTIKMVLIELNPDEKESLNALVTKLRSKSRYQDDQKLMRYLAGKGFDYSSIKEAINRSS